MRCLRSVWLAIWTAVAMAVPASALAQDVEGTADPERWRVPFEGELGFAVGLPQNELSEEVKDSGFGFDLYMGVGLDELPIAFGAELGFVTYGSKTRTQRVSGVRVDVTTDNNILLGHLVVRIRPRDWVVRPYVEGLVGFKLFFTDTTVRNPDGSGSIASNNNNSDAAFSYGAGGGVIVPIFGGPVYVSAGARYLFGTRASYLSKGSVDVKTSDTDLLLVNMGIGVAF
jgi:hypothetical protein